MQKGGKPHREDIDDAQFRHALHDEVIYPAKQFGSLLQEHGQRVRTDGRLHKGIAERSLSSSAAAVGRYASLNNEVPSIVSKGTPRKSSIVGAISTKLVACVSTAGATRSCSTARNGRVSSGPQPPCSP
jgi:hypothetical protein